MAAGVAKRMLPTCSESRWEPEGAETLELRGAAAQVAPVGAQAVASRACSAAARGTMAVLGVAGVPGALEPGAAHVGCWAPVPPMRLRMYSSNDCARACCCRPKSNASSIRLRSCNTSNWCLSSSCRMRLSSASTCSAATGRPEATPAGVPLALRSSQGAPRESSAASQAHTALHKRCMTCLATSELCSEARAPPTARGSASSLSGDRRALLREPSDATTAVSLAGEPAALQGLLLYLSREPLLLGTTSSAS